MRSRPLFLALLLVAMAFSLARALVTRDNVGPFEYVVSVVLLAVLVFGVLRFSRRATRRA
jgi:hypothetical protein